jgi:hypothetical protein
MSARRMKNPANPIAYMIRTSTKLFARLYTPSVANTRMAEYSSGCGIDSSFTQTLTIGRLSTSSMTLPM